MLATPPLFVDCRGVKAARFVALGLIGFLTVWPAARVTRGGEASRDGLLLEYHFEGNAADSSGNKHDGKTAGGVRFAPGKLGQCVALDGQGAYVDCGTSLAELGQTFTVECWVNPADRQQLHADLFGNHGHGGFGLVVEQDGGNANRFYAGYGTGQGQWLTTRPVQLAAGKWQHLAVVKTASELKLYLNGIPVSVAKCTAPLQPSPNMLRVGDSINDVARCFQGQIDEFRVWNKALTDFDLGLSPEEKLTALAQAIQLRFESLEPDASAAAGQPAWQLSLDESLVPCLPPEVNEIVLELEAEDWRGGDAVRLPAMRLTRTAGFKARSSPPLTPGFYLVRCRPSLVTATGSFAGRPDQFSRAAFGPAPRAKPVPAGPSQPIPDGGQPTQVIRLNGAGWTIATDAKNEGRQQKWFQAPVPEAKPTPVPWVIQDVFPDYHGVAWYWRDFAVPAHFHTAGRYLLRFHAVDYLADVWLNGTYVGGHEGGETPFVLDITQAVKPGASNRLAVRVLNPTYEPIDGISLKQTASGAKQHPVACNSVYNSGGIVDAVELVLAPAVRIENLHVLPDWKTGEIRIRASVRNAGTEPVAGSIRWSVAPAAGGESRATDLMGQTLPPGETLVEGRIRVPDHRLWQLNDPFLYRVTVRVQAAGVPAFDEQSVRCGFRDFRFEHGYFRLNGQRIFLHGNMHFAHYPVGYTVPLDPDMLRRDVLNMKAAGINLCRVAFGGTVARQLDVFDELGVLVYEEHYGSWQLQDSPHLQRRYQRSLGEIILRDRNHPSIVIWGLLNEIAASDPVFRLAIDSLPLVRWLDGTRMCLLNSGRFDGDYSQPSLSNPGSRVWETDLRDVHGYPPVPHSAGLLRSMRSSGSAEGLWNEAGAGHPAGAPSFPLFVSEYGQCGAVDLVRTLRQYEQRGHEQADDARYFRRQLDKFLADWQAWGLDQVWTRPEDFFLDSHANVVKLHRIGANALRANPHLVGFSSTHPIAEIGFQGSSASNLFRDLKPGLLDATWELTAPLRWSLFAEPVHVVRGARVKLEAVLVNEDKLRPGKYPVRLQLIGPNLTRIWEQTVAAEIPEPGDVTEPPFAQRVFADEMPVDGPAGKYRFVATMLAGGAPQGGDAEFYVADPAAMPAVDGEIVLWGDDPPLRQWLAAQGIRTREFSPVPQPAHSVILVSGKPPAPGGAAVFAELTGHIERGSTAVFLDPATFGEGPDATRWLPLQRRGRYGPIHWVGGYYRADVWAKDHPIFEGLPSGGVLDPTFYRELLPQQALLKCYTVGRGFTEEEVTGELDPPLEVVCGANRLSANYASGLHVAVYQVGAGRFILNNLLVRENLGRSPPAERLLRNMLNYAAREQK